MKATRIELSPTQLKALRWLGRGALHRDRAGFGPQSEFTIERVPTRTVRVLANLGLASLAHFDTSALITRRGRALLRKQLRSPVCEHAARSRSSRQ